MNDFGIALPIKKSIALEVINDDDLLEELSSLEHEQWMDFAMRISPEIDPEHAEAWKKLYIPYEEFVGESIQKGINTYTPAPNIVWSILRQEGYSFSVRGNKATLPNGCTIEINNSKVKIEGKSANKVFQLLRTKMEQKQASDDWIDGHMVLRDNW